MCCLLGLVAQLCPTLFFFFAPQILLTVSQDVLSHICIPIFILGPDGRYRIFFFSTPDCGPVRLPCPWGFSRQESWSGLPFPSPEDLPNPEIKPMSHSLQVDSLPFEPPGKQSYKECEIG